MPEAHAAVDAFEPPHLSSKARVLELHLLLLLKKKNTPKPSPSLSLSLPLFSFLWSLASLAATKSLPTTNKQKDSSGSVILARDRRRRRILSRPHSNRPTLRSLATEEPNPRGKRMDTWRTRRILPAPDKKIIEQSDWLTKDLGRWNVRSCTNEKREHLPTYLPTYLPIRWAPSLPSCLPAFCSDNYH